MAELPITNGFYKSRSLPISAQECTNWYPVVNQAPALSAESLFGTPGVKSLTTTGTIKQINRGMHVKNSIAYTINGDTLYRIDRGIVSGEDVFSTTALGVIEGEGRVSTADNGRQLMVLVPGGKGYIFNEDDGTPFQEITDLDFTANGLPQQVKFIDGYFAVTTDGKKWIVSSLNDGLSWNALDFASAESDPDTIVAPAVVNNQIFITGSETTEGNQNIGGAGFPFQRNNVFMDKGCFAPFSIIQANSTFFMIGGGTNESPAIWQFTGTSFQKVSTDAIDAILEDSTDQELGEAFSWQYAQSGAYFVGFTFSGRTFVYDMTAGRWHERKSQFNEVSNRWRINSMVKAYGRILVGDSVDGRIGELSLDHFQEYDSDIIRVVSTQPFANGGLPVTVGPIELTMEAGVGNGVADPVVSLALSADGKKFNYERSRKIGKVGRFGQRSVWRRNGSFNRFTVMRFRFSDAVKPVIIKLEIT